MVPSQFLMRRGCGPVGDNISYLHGLWGERFQAQLFSCSLQERTLQSGIIIREMSWFQRLKIVILVSFNRSFCLKKAWTIIHCSEQLDLTILTAHTFIIHCFDQLGLPILTKTTFFLICLVWSQSLRHSISRFLNRVFSQLDLFSIRSFLNSIFSQSDLFSIGSFLNSIFSQFDLFSIRSFLNSIFSQSDLFSIGSFLKWIFLGSPPYAIFQ